MNSGSENANTNFITQYETFMGSAAPSSTSTPLKMYTSESSMMNISREIKEMQELSRISNIKPSTVTSSTASAIYNHNSSLATFETRSMVRLIPPYATIGEFKPTDTPPFIYPSNMYSSNSNLTSEYPNESRGWYPPIPQLIIPSTHRIHINPSILSQIKEEPVESKKNCPPRRKKSKRSKKSRRRYECPLPSLKPKQLAHYILNIQTNSKCQNKKSGNDEKRSNEPPKQQSTVIERQRKRSDARLWLQAKAQLVAQAQSATNKTNSSIKLQTSSTIKRFVDRATSPIDFKDEQIKPKTCDVALSPIKYIEPNLKRPLNGNSIDLSAKSSPIPLKHKCFLHTTLEHKCSKCEMFKHLDKCCPTCRAVSALSASE